MKPKFNYKRLKDARKENGLNVHKASLELYKSGLTISHMTLRSWESGTTTPNCRDIEYLCFFYGKNVLYFFN